MTVKTCKGNLNMNGLKKQQVTETFKTLKNDEICTEDRSHLMTVKTCKGNLYMNGLKKQQFTETFKTLKNDEICNLLKNQPRY